MLKRISTIALSFAVLALGSFATPRSAHALPLTSKTVRLSFEQGSAVAPCGWLANGTFSCPEVVDHYQSGSANVDTSESLTCSFTVAGQYKSTGNGTITITPDPGNDTACLPSSAISGKLFAATGSTGYGINAVIAASAPLTAPYAGFSGTLNLPWQGGALLTSPSTTTLSGISLDLTIGANNGGVDTDY